MSEVECTVRTQLTALWTKEPFDLALLVCYSDNGLNNEPFYDQTGLNHLIAWLVCYSGCNHTNLNSRHECVHYSTIVTIKWSRWTKSPVFKWSGPSKTGHHLKSGHDQPFEMYYHSSLCKRLVQKLDTSLTNKWNDQRSLKHMYNNIFSSLKKFATSLLAWLTGGLKFTK